MRGSSTYRRCVAILLGSCFAGLVFAQSAPPADAIVTGPLARKVSKGDRQGIDVLFDAAAEAWRKKDMQALVALYDFPIYVGTDNSAGMYQGGEWVSSSFATIWRPRCMPIPRACRARKRARRTS